MKSGFFDKLIDRLDKLDPQSLQAQFLRLAQERGLLETIFQSLHEGVVVIDGRGRVDYANRAAENLLGFELAKARGRPAERYLREIDWDRILSLDEAEWSRLISSEIEITYPQHRFLNFYVVPLAGEPSVESTVVVILRDVTHERKEDETLLESERLNAVKLLAAGVAHEIGNPLNALTIHLQLVERELAGLRSPDSGSRPGEIAGAKWDEIGELVGIARDEVSRLDLIITQFLRAIRPSKPSLHVCRIETLLKETVTLLKQEIQDRRIQVELEMATSLPKVRIDRSQMKQAFFNIIRNAFQAMPDGGVLQVHVSRSDQHLAVSFRDNGVGINADDMGRLFEPYYTTREEGSGLGLMIVQRIVQDHGGQIEIVSKKDVGTSLTVLLPLVERRVRLLSRGGKRQAVSDEPINRAECE